MKKSISNKIISSELLKFLKKKTKKKITIKTDFIGDDIVDSLLLIEVISFLEKRFNLKISISNVSVDNFKSIEKLVSFVKKK